MYRVLEFKYDKLYKEIYAERHQILLGEKPPQATHLEEYEARAKVLDDEQFKTLEVNPVEVKDI